MKNRIRVDFDRLLGMLSKACIWILQRIFFMRKKQEEDENASMHWRFRRRLCLW